MCMHKKQVHELLIMICSACMKHLCREMKALVERQKLDRRRLEAAHFQFAVLHVAIWYPQHITISELPLHSALLDTLPKVVAVYHGAFMEKYASEFLLSKQVCP